MKITLASSYYVNEPISVIIVVLLVQNRPLTLLY